MALLPWQSAIVEQVLPESPGTNRYFLRLPDTQAFDFVPGQFITVDLPIHEQRNKRWRSYSIASAPSGTNTIELLIVRAEPSEGGSAYIWEHWKPGTVVPMRGPQGTFTVPSLLPEESLFLICTGTGVAPFRSMLQHWHQSGTFPQQPIYLIFGGRRREDLLYESELRGLADQYPQFRYLPTLSREAWDGAMGYVHAVYEPYCSQCPSAQFMICGWRTMVDETKHRLEALGYDRKQIHLELYG
ncbi:MAG: oxidoreductase [Sphingobacteriales bacterium]|nr:MAG: oxidoreductase [Sphingobacteriales bacterium]